jgi:hypothetical protein
MRYAPFQKGSDKVVAALKVARQKSKFWQALENFRIRLTPSEKNLLVWQFL